MSEHLTIIWRPYFDDAAVANLTEIGTLPRNETIIEDYDYDSGEDVAAEVARVEHNFCSDIFVNGGDMVILEPENYAGRYDIFVDWEPTFSANVAKPVLSPTDAIESRRLQSSTSVEPCGERSD